MEKISHRRIRTVARWTVGSTVISTSADKFAPYLPASFVDRDCFVYAVIAIREGPLTMMHHDFSREEADDVIAYLLT